MNSPVVNRQKIDSDDRSVKGGRLAQVLPFRPSDKDDGYALPRSGSAALALSHFRFDDSGSDRKLADYLIIGVLSLFVHSVAVEYFKHSDVEPVAVEKTPKPPSKVQISFVKPQPPKPVVVPPPPPKVVAIKKPPKPKVPPKPVPQVIEQPVQTSNVVADAPVVAAPPAPPPPPPVEKVTEPRGGAGYLNNPAPVYPDIAMERGWEGKVLLKVHVLASGEPDNVSVSKTSGQKILDDEAVRTVKKWSFAPATRGTTPIDGWVTVPISFKL